MKVEKSIVLSRRNQIKKILEQKGSVQVNDLASLFNISPLTIRRDLQELEEEGFLVRFYGGATKSDNGNDNFLSSKLTLHKHAIAREAAKMVEDGDTIFINTSSTALLIMKYITARQVTVITNNGKAIYADKGAYDMIVVLTGGELRFPKESMVGDFAINTITKVTASKCFIGCAGLTPEQGITTRVLQEAAINETMLQRTAGAKVVVADYQKIGTHHSFVSGSIASFDTLITDTFANKEILDKLQTQNISVSQVVPLKKF